MQAKNVLYAAVGAPVVAARKVSDQVSTWKTKVNKETANYTDVAEKTLNTWASEGERVLNRISDGAVVEELTQKMDLDQAKEQVGKLRDQLEDMLETWRHSFKPEEKTAANAPKPAAKTTAQAKKTTAAKASTTKKPAAKKPAAAKSAASSATKKAASKSSTASKTSKAS